MKDPENFIKISQSSETGSMYFGKRMSNPDLLKQKDGSYKTSSQVQDSSSIGGHKAASGTNLSESFDTNTMVQGMGAGLGAQKDGDTEMISEESPDIKDTKSKSKSPTGASKKKGKSTGKTGKVVKK